MGPVNYPSFSSSPGSGNETRTVSALVIHSGMSGVEFGHAVANVLGAFAGSQKYV
jgi:hypothetical protein